MFYLLLPNLLANAPAATYLLVDSLCGQYYIVHTYYGYI